VRHLLRWWRYPLIRYAATSVTVSPRASLDQPEVCSFIWVIPAGIPAENSFTVKENIEMLNIPKYTANNDYKDVPKHGIIKVRIRLQYRLDILVTYDRFPLLRPTRQRLRRSTASCFTTSFANCSSCWPSSWSCPRTTFSMCVPCLVGWQETHFG
jgi:hypothetical protein